MAESKSPRASRPTARVAAAGTVIAIFVALPVGVLSAVDVSASPSRSPGPGQVPANKAPTAKLVGQLLMGRMIGTQPGSRLLGRIRRGELGGLIIFPDNFASLGQLRSTIATLQRTATAGGNPPLLIATDQEGGTVARLPDGPPGLSARQMGATGTRASVFAAGRDTGLYLRRLGITVNFAPVLDVPDSASNFLGSRAFDRHPGVVARIGTAFAQGQQVTHVAATAKHFPGLGTATANTDLGVVAIETRKSTLRWRMRPFRAAIRGGIRVVMVSNASYSALDPTGVPAALSQPIVGDLLRRQLGFRGVVITDAFSTPSPARYRDAPARAIASGVDVLLYSDSEPASDEAFTALSVAAGSKALPRVSVERAYARVMALKQWIAGLR